MLSKKLKLSWPEAYLETSQTFKHPSRHRNGQGNVILASNLLNIISNQE